MVFPHRVPLLVVLLLVGIHPITDCQCGSYLHAALPTPLCDSKNPSISATVYADVFTTVAMFLAGSLVVVALEHLSTLLYDAKVLINVLFIFSCYLCFAHFRFVSFHFALFPTPKKWSRFTLVSLCRDTVISLYCANSLIPLPLVSGLQSARLPVLILPIRRRLVVLFSLDLVDRSYLFCAILRPSPLVVIYIYNLLDALLVAFRALLVAVTFFLFLGRSFEAPHFPQGWVNSYPAAGRSCACPFCLGYCPLVVSFVLMGGVLSAHFSGFSR